MADQYRISGSIASYYPDSIASSSGSYVKKYYMTKDGKPNLQQRSKFELFIKDHLESKSNEKPIGESYGVLDPNRNKSLKHYGFAIVYQIDESKIFVNCCYWRNHELMGELFLFDGEKVTKISLDKRGFMSPYDCHIILGEANRWLKCNNDRMSGDALDLYAECLVEQGESNLEWPVDSLDVDLNYIGVGNYDPYHTFKVFSMSEKDHDVLTQDNLDLDGIVEFVRTVGEDKKPFYAIYYPDDDEINICYKDNNGNFFARIFDMSTNEESPVDEYAALCYNEAVFLAYCLGLCDMDFMFSG